MTFTAVMPNPTNLLAQVAEPALRALALAGVVGAGLRMFRVRSTSVRLLSWTAVLYGALALPLLGCLLPPVTLRMPGFAARLLGPDDTAARNQSLDRRFSPSRSWAKEYSSESSKRELSGRGDGISSAVADEAIPPTARTYTERSRSVSALGVLRHPKSVLNRLFASQDLSAWSSIAAWIYMAGSSLLLLRFLMGIVLAGRLRRKARLIGDLRATERLKSRTYASGLQSIPDLAESEFVSVPVTLGALRSTILLPLEWRGWGDAKLDAVIAHEVAHVARRDGLTQRFSLVHRALFWFSPLPWWLDRKLAELAEQASDEAALSGGADRNEYAKTLLGFFEALQAAPGRVWWQGVAMAKAGVSDRQTARLVEERLERILSWKGSVAMGAKNMTKKSMAAAVLVFAVPVVYLAASARPSGASLEAQEASQQTPSSAPTAATPVNTPVNSAKPSAAIVPDAHAAPTIVPDEQEEPLADPEITEAPEAAPAPEAEPMPGAIARGISGGFSGGLGAPLAPMAPPAAGITAYPPNSRMAPLAPWPPAPPRAYSSYSYGNGQSNSSYSSAASSDVMAYSSNGGSFYRYSYDTDNDEHWVMVSGKSDSLTMSGDMGDARHVEKLRKQIQGDFIWFERGDKSYVIRDQATIDRARKLWEPQDQLGKKQEAIGVQQEALGKQQEELGSRMEQVRVKVPDMTAELDKLKEELKVLSSNATMEDVGRVQSEIGGLQSKIAELQSQAGEQQSKLGQQQRMLGEKQSMLGLQQSELGRQQAALAREANRQMTLLLDEAIKKGIAQLEL